MKKASRPSLAGPARGRGARAEVRAPEAGLPTPFCRVPGEHPLVPSSPARPNPGSALRQLQEAQAALEAATQACDEAFRDFARAPTPLRDRHALEVAARGFSEAQRRLVHAQAAMRHPPPAEKSWGAH